MSTGLILRKMTRSNKSIIRKEKILVTENTVQERGFYGCI